MHNRVCAYITVIHTCAQGGGPISHKRTDFNATSVADLKVRVVADLDADRFDVYWQTGTGPEQNATGIAMAAAGLQFDQVRIAANTNTTDWGAGDSVAVSGLKLSKIP